MAQVCRALVAVAPLAATTLSGFFYVREVRSVGGFLPSFFPRGMVGGWPFPFITFGGGNNVAVRADGSFNVNPYFFAFDFVVWFLPLALLTPLLLWAYSKLRRHFVR